jgi:hypothetical protein
MQNRFRGIAAVQACHSHAGYVLDQEGDSWCIAFHDALDAVAFSLQVSYTPGIYLESTRTHMLNWRLGHMPRQASSTQVPQNRQQPAYCLAYAATDALHE